MTGNCWEVNRWSTSPDSIVITRETKGYYFYESTGFNGEAVERRLEKGGSLVFATWEEAKAYMSPRPRMRSNTPSRE